MDPLSLALLITGVVSVVAGTGISAWQGVENKRATEDYNKKMLEEQERARAWQVGQARYQDRYNSPSAQLARMTAAGINPHAQFAGGERAAQAGTPAMAQQQPEVLDLSGTLNAMQMFNGVMQNLAAMEQSESQYSRSLEQQVKEFNAREETRKINDQILQENLEHLKAVNPLIQKMTKEEAEVMQPLQTKLMELSVQHSQEDLTLKQKVRPFIVAMTESDAEFAKNRAKLSGIELEIADALREIRKAIPKEELEKLRKENALLQNSIDSLDDENAMVKMDRELMELYMSIRRLEQYSLEQEAKGNKVFRNPYFKAGMKFLDIIMRFMGKGGGAVTAPSPTPNRSVRVNVKKQ